MSNNSQEANTTQKKSEKNIFTPKVVIISLIILTAISVLILSQIDSDKEVSSKFEKLPIEQQQYLSAYFNFIQDTSPALTELGTLLQDAENLYKSDWVLKVSGQIVIIQMASETMKNTKAPVEFEKTKQSLDLVCSNYIDSMKNLTKGIDDLDSKALKKADIQMSTGTNILKETSNYIAQYLEN